MSQEILKRLEPVLNSGLKEEYSLASIAISLKRIADRLDNLHLEMIKWKDSKY